MKLLRFGSFTIKADKNPQTFPLARFPKMHGKYQKVISKEAYFKIFCIGNERQDVARNKTPFMMHSAGI